MGKEFQKSALLTLFHFVRVRAAIHPHVLSRFLAQQFLCFSKKTRDSAGQSGVIFNQSLSLTNPQNEATPDFISV